MQISISPHKMGSLQAVRVLEQSLISPPPGSVAKKAPLPLNFFDVFWLYAHPVQRLFFYEFPHPTTHFIESFLPNLKSSLSLTLQHFYSLSGRLKSSSTHPGKFELCYTDGDSVLFTVAEYGGGSSFDEISGNQMRDLTKIQTLIPQLPELDSTAPLLAIQATVFPNSGIVIGVTIHHVAADGSGFMHFIKSWASACRSGGSTTTTTPLVAAPPFYDRSVIADPNGLYSIFFNDMQSAKTDLIVNSSDHHAGGASLNFASVSLGLLHIQKLKNLVMAKAKGSNTPLFHCSTFVVVCAYIWICLVKAQGQESNEIVHFVFAVDCRGRLRPPIPAAYFGNCTGGCFVEAKGSDLVGEEGLLTASVAIGKAIDKLEDGALQGAEGWIKRFQSLASERVMSIAGSPKFGVYETDFGWGRPKKVELPSIYHTGAISLAESREEQGGIEIGLALLKPEMDEFHSHFSNGLKLLSS